jgi:ABC-type transporter Mla maintaining outer membrane lipid asymmetry ATPase subunit MlaF
MEELERLVDEIGSLHTKLILLIGSPGSGKTRLLRKLADQTKSQALNISLALGKRLAPLTQRQRQLSVNRLVCELADGHAKTNLLLIDNIELLFDHSLRVSPLDILRQQAHAKRVVAVWPGELRDGRLKYAEMGHPEHQDYSSDGLVTFKIQ